MPTNLPPWSVRKDGQCIERQCLERSMGPQHIEQEVIDRVEARHGGTPFITTLMKAIYESTKTHEHIMTGHGFQNHIVSYPLIT